MKKIIAYCAGYKEVPNTKKEWIRDIVLCVLVLMASIVSWLSGFFVMRIVYRSIYGAVLFASVLSVMIFCSCRLSFMSLKIDGKVTISREEVSSNLLQIIYSLLVGTCIAIPGMLKILEPQIETIGTCMTDLTSQLTALKSLISARWLTILVIWLAVEAIYMSPIIIKLKSDE